MIIGKQCRHAKFKGTMTKWPVQRKHTEQYKRRRTPRRNRHSKITLLLCKYDVCRSGKRVNIRNRSQFHESVSEAGSLTVFNTDALFHVSVTAKVDTI